MEIKSYFEKLRKIVSAHPKGKPLSKDGFWPDPTPMEPPIGNPNVAEIDMFARHREMIRRELSAYAAAQGMETFEEADDFDIADELPEPFSPWEQIAGFSLEDVPSDLDPAPNPPPLAPAGTEQGGESGGATPQPPPAKPAPAGG